jgi:hypothetical protein
MAVTSSSETLVLRRGIRHHTPEDSILHSHHHENVKSYIDNIYYLTIYNLFQKALLSKLEAISVTVPGERFSSLAAQHFREQVTKDIMNANTDFMEGLYGTLIGLPLWKLYRTDSYRKLESSHEVIYR